MGMGHEWGAGVIHKPCRHDKGRGGGMGGLSNVHINYISPNK